MPKTLINKRFYSHSLLPEKEIFPELQINPAYSTNKTQNSLSTSGADKNLSYLDFNVSDLKNYEKINKINRKKNKNRAIENMVASNSFNTDNNVDKFYNLTKLAEVSLAAAAGQLLSKNFNAEVEQKQTCEEQNYGKDFKKEAFFLTSPDSKASDIYSCLDCGKRYSTSSNLARHKQTHRSLADKKARACPHCAKIYVSMPAFSMHVRTHSQGCRCLFCGKCFSRPWLLQGHIRTHTGEKPFKCTVCEKAFADKSNLRAHVQTHSNMKPHICGRCGKAFALKSYLYKHEESSCLKTQITSDNKFSAEDKKLERIRIREDIFNKPILSIPTPVISIAIRV